MRGLGRRLRDGRPVLDETGQRLLVVDVMGQVIHQVELAALVDSDWGYVYERHVGLHFEANGYQVGYCGLERGYADSGIDLVATKPGNLPCYVQCKYQRKSKISRQAMEWVLYKADRYLQKVLPAQCGRPSAIFVLAVPALQESFAQNMRHKGKMPVFPVADYFLAQNSRQNRVSLEILELSLPSSPI